MNNPTCHKIQEALVEYADGELSSADARLVVEHLTRCASCREQLQCLRRSLELAQQVWRESPVERIPLVAPASRPYQSVAMLATCAAILLLVTGLLIKGRLIQVDSGPEPSHAQVAPATASSPVDVAAETSELPPDSGDDGEEVIQWIARQERIARLRAAAEILGSEPELADYKRRADQYLITVYGHQPANGDNSQ